MTESTFLAGRVWERAELTDALESDRPELIAVYGRRRVGKTYLIRGFFAEQICFELTGARDANLKEQLTNFVACLRPVCPIRLRCRPRGRTRSRC